MENILKYKKELERITQSGCSKQQRKQELAELLNDMANEFSIPLFSSEAFKKEYKDVMDVFDAIIMASVQVQEECETERKTALEKMKGTDTSPKEKKMEEVREDFLNHVRDMVDYWHDVPNKTEKEKLNGLAFSIMAALDGCSVDIPGFIVAPLPHETNKQYHMDNEEDYYPENHNSEVNCNIAGELHDHYYK